MKPRSMPGFRGPLSLATALLCAGALSGAPTAGAPESGEVAVTASVDAVEAQISITLCDTSADFGGNLDAGGSPSVGTDPVHAIPLEPGAGLGAFYRWDPVCTAPPGHLITVRSSAPWSDGVCATENGGTSSLSLADGDLRFHPTAWTYFEGADFATYSRVDLGAVPFRDCGQGTTDWVAIWNAFNAGYECGFYGFCAAHFFYYLQVDPDETPGTFNSTTVWTVTL